MKVNHLILVLGLLLFSFSTNAQSSIERDSTGLPGDHFSLEGALELFKKASSPEDFEKKLNQEDFDVNNLDLNEDGNIDYIRVVDNAEGDAHAIVLQVPVSVAESQDIAVIEIEKTGEEEAVLQIVGDDLLYGDSIIVEPYEIATNEDGRGPCVVVERVFVNVYLWPSVRYIYGPRYRSYASPYRWGHYPNWWRPWRPRTYRTFRTLNRVYQPNYRVTTTHRVVKAHRVYAPKRKTSTTVHARTSAKHAAVAGKNVRSQKTNATSSRQGQKINAATANKKVASGNNVQTQSSKAQSSGQGQKANPSTTNSKVASGQKVQGNRSSSQSSGQGKKINTATTKNTNPAGSAKPKKKNGFFKKVGELAKETGRQIDKAAKDAATNPNSKWRNAGSSQGKSTSSSGSSSSGNRKYSGSSSKAKSSSSGSKSSSKSSGSKQSKAIGQKKKGN